MRIRRRIAAAGAAIALACGLGLSGCSPEGGDTAATTGAQGTVEAEEGAFPVTISHAFGETTIEQAPTRVVALGETDLDPVLAFGVTPVWVKTWGDPGARAWQQPLMGDAEPVWFEDNEVDAEEIAAVQPDLILALWSELDQEQYDKLSQIAPTVTYQEGQGSYQQGWQDNTLTAGRALGQPAKAEELIGEVERRFGELRGRHSEWEGKTIAIASVVDGELGAYTSDDPRANFFTRLGFVVPEKIDELGEGGHGAGISEENADLLDVDLLLWSDGDCDEDYKDLPTINSLDVAKSGRSLCVQEILQEEEMRAAFNWQTGLSLQYLMDGIEQPLAEVMGD
ncbi:ABC transporter substrate-binding protein [Corynebacterium sphenisci]|uniref:ABC transporter substrate-binding protein n=1 Tax=Corynebacterium sphenisci TaxID=191493 RepID=UPI0026DECA30|nr:ABC transporter substrate-binding protein [Corynebacterium sphenisci]MDO5730560.1 ABC transporter substrate-binding protein [Corynebacterium sphenisci]